MKSKLWGKFKICSENLYTSFNHSSVIIVIDLQSLAYALKAAIAQIYNTICVYDYLDESCKTPLFN